MACHTSSYLRSVKKGPPKLHKAALCLCTPAYLPLQITYTHHFANSVYSNVYYCDLKRWLCLSVPIQRAHKDDLLPPELAVLDGRITCCLLGYCKTLSLPNTSCFPFPLMSLQQIICTLLINFRALPCAALFFMQSHGTKRTLAKAACD